MAFVPVQYSISSETEDSALFETSHMILDIFFHMLSVIYFIYEVK